MAMANDTYVIPYHEANFSFRFEATKVNPQVINGKYPL